MINNGENACINSMMQLGYKYIEHKQKIDNMLIDIQQHTFFISIF